MNVIKIVYIESEDTNACYLNSKQAKAYNLSADTSYINIKFGSLNTCLNKVVINHNTDDNTLFLSKDLRLSAFIPSDTLLQLKETEENSIEIGPIVGVFINSKKAAAMSEGKSDSVYEQISIASKSLYGISCFFSYGDIDWDKRIVKALVWNGSSWISRILPLPTVIYDRCFGAYGRLHAMEFRDRLGKGYKVINSIPKLAKLETINALRKNSSLIHCIPETAIYHSVSDIEKMLSKYPSVYLKPDALYKGKGIFRVSKDYIAGYKVEHRAEDENEVIYISTLHSIDSLICDYAVLGGGYLIQAEIKKASYHEYPFDFRLLYQKDWQGKWQPSGIAVRMGAPGSVITSPRSGGAVAQFSSVLKATFNEDLNTPNGIYENVVRIGREVSQTIDREFGDCVELGLDMTIDINKNIWIIEVNGKPLKVSLKWLNDKALMTRCYNRPLEYAVFLTGFKSANTETGGITR